jgi:hypothetical protein
MESTCDAGLTVTYDEETGIFSFEWDEETHPEYNFIKDLTPETFATMIFEQIVRLDLDLHEPQASNDSTEVQAG